MHPALPLGILGLGLLLLSKKSEAVNQSSFTSAVTRMRGRDAVGLLSLSQDKAFDPGTQTALREQAVRMNARMRGTVPPLPVISTGQVDIDNNEFAARVMALEGNPVTLAAWATAYRPIYGAVADALMAKAVQVSVALALASGKPTVMRATAKRLREQGFTVAAEQLEIEANRREQGPPVPQSLPVTVPVSIPGVGTVSVPAPVTSVPSISIPSTVPPAIPSSLPAALPPTVQVDAKTARARNTALHLSGVRRYKEDRELVRLYQLDNGLKDDGMYGVSTALSLTKYGIIPPKPFYFSKKTAVSDKRQYKAALAQRAVADVDQSPERQALWREAMKVDNL